MVGGSDQSRLRVSRISIEVISMISLCFRGFEIQGVVNLPLVILLLKRWGL